MSIKKNKVNVSGNYSLDTYLTRIPSKRHYIKVQQLPSRGFIYILAPTKIAITVDFKRISF